MVRLHGTSNYLGVIWTTLNGRVGRIVSIFTFIDVLY